LRQLKKKTDKVSAEVCPHHLLLTQKDVERLGNFARMKPELGTEEDRIALWDGVEEGIIDMFATDHAPHSKEKKERTEPCWGVPGVGERFSLLWTEWEKRGWDPRRFSDMMGGLAAERFGLGNFGVLKEGAIADVVLIDPEESFEIQTYLRPGMCNWSPYDGRMVKGNVIKTWISGVKIWDGKHFLDGFIAPEVKPER
jgi:dihydroorotase